MAKTGLRAAQDATRHPLTAINTRLAESCHPVREREDDHAKINRTSRGVSFRGTDFQLCGWGQDASYCAPIYKENCIVCHGETGVGDGTVGMLFAMRPADLKLLEQVNNGVFPKEQATEAIYGHRPIQTHGQTDMPVWGRCFMKEALENRAIDAADAAMIAQGRVLSVVSYLESIQVE